MKDDNGNDLQPGDRIEGSWQVDQSIEPDVGEDTVLYEGEYHIYVPPGQRAIVRYETSVSTEGENDKPRDNPDDGVVFNANDHPG